MDEQGSSSASLYPNILESGLPSSLPLNAYGELDIKKEFEVKAEPSSSDGELDIKKEFEVKAGPSSLDGEGQPTATLGSTTDYPAMVQNSKSIGSRLADFAVARSSSNDTAPSDPLFTCAECRKEFHRIQELRFHVRTHKFLLCVKCGKHFDSLAELVGHSKKFPHAHGGHHACPECGLGFDGREELEKHSYLHGLSFSITCQGLEGKIYDFFNFLKIVMKTPYKDLNLISDGEEAAKPTSADEKPPGAESSISPKVIKVCLLCRDVCIGNEAYTNHINYKHSCNDYVEPITCKVCCCTFITLTARKAHLNLFHTLDEDYEPLAYRQHKCSQCERAYGTVSALRGHIRTAHVEGCAPCQLCPDKFSSKAELDAHLVDAHGVAPAKKRRVRARPTPLACDMCEFRAQTSADLSQHKVTHSNIQTFVCSICPSRFQTMLRCREHIRKSHSTYKCALCPKSFKSLSGLNTHLRFHNSLRPYDCPGCGKAFHTKQNMLVHRDKHCKVKIEDDATVTECEPTE